MPILKIIFSPLFGTTERSTVQSTAWERHLFVMTMTSNDPCRTNSPLVSAANSAHQCPTEVTSMDRHDLEFHLLSPSRSASLPFSLMESRPSFDNVDAGAARPLQCPSVQLDVFGQFGL